MIIVLIVLLSIIGYAFIAVTTAAIIRFKLTTEIFFVIMGAVYWPAAIVVIIGYLIFLRTGPVVKFIYRLFGKWYEFVGRTLVPNK